MALILLLAVALAHDLRPGAVALQEQEPGVYALRLTEPLDGGRITRLEPRWPADCAQVGALLRCPEGLQGELLLPGLDSRRVKVLVRVQHLDGSVEEALLREGQVRLQLGQGRPPWLRLGLGHVLAGLDHVAFVCGLGLVAAGWRRLLAAVSAFTLGHSLTLGLAAAGLLVLPSAAVELLIALSVLLVAREGLGRQQTLTRRLPWVVAALFGLVHGVGFAGALVELGLPEEGLLGPLLAFNLGVELGQVVVLAAALGLAAGWRRLGLPAGRRLVAYAIGLPAGTWVIARLLAWMG